ncbi:helix-hairpin-helix domain-containing protein [Halalkalibacter nanhaiisediminis]|uniref:Competence protein ComEA n=1 Tax=Halalkalibacter nanhaiisediminis TaxID=688079 RepID=A0A562QHZ7_9BACI|nr:helix-hairpin-helix domain-containing protein [Halalkalibacter nanhaiisediminis]TWI56377.1 competence protein ComEA [Halalkalibacter nanhaiisediminis]
MNIKTPERKHVVFLIGIVLLVSLVLFLHFRNAEMEEVQVDWSNSFLEDNETEEVEEIVEPAFYVVDIKGAVQHPGVYELAQGSRVHEVIKRAGGFLEEADQKQLNLAELLHDEMMIYVPIEGEEVHTTNINTADGGNSDGRIAINSADAQALEQLPGIGPAKAQAIIAYRDEHGPFKEVDDLLNVSGIGPKSLEQFREMVIIQ